MCICYNADKAFLKPLTLYCPGYREEQQATVYMMQCCFDQTKNIPQPV